VRIAITRGVSPSIERCELTYLEPEAINIDVAKEQHGRYERCLAELGCDVQSLPPESDLPDSVFVEDTAVVVEELALLTRPGAESRRPEIPSVAKVLGQYRRLAYVAEPGTVDGGDVLVLDRNVFIGLSGRTDEDGVRQVRAVLGPLGYTVTAVPVRACLHLKSAVGRVGPDTLLINRGWVDGKAFGDVKLIDVDPAEPRAAGALLIGDTVVYPARFKRTLERLHKAGIRTKAVEFSEIAKAEAGVTCCSLVFEG
jgi:dimethylargininase